MDSVTLSVTHSKTTQLHSPFFIPVLSMSFQV